MNNSNSRKIPAEVAKKIIKNKYTDVVIVYPKLGIKFGTCGHKQWSAFCSLTPLNEEKEFLDEFFSILKKNPIIIFRKKENESGFFFEIETKVKKEFIERHTLLNISSLQNDSIPMLFVISGEFKRDRNMRDFLNLYEKNGYFDLRYGETTFEIRRSLYGKT
ncbi:hypothetical protein A2997_02580 [Candidatus Nomurabacteria bacterium RIFCSPLOWO2_01_FULL_36_10b]|uniref:Uncharacterized protein n=1 Tax=Candidatus Nomurabacteria bacterium RIFCSPLOWO2_01_FULL_36_10b TaxID=1801766 RepID=A0A1F6WNE6_9BACT|nr:MAG: hypothetical protein A2997_02580 [Candidatus Nomurabacteria bacterium RIFCSPLOWO2_01_FULL_36_10b]